MILYPYLYLVFSIVDVYIASTNAFYSGKQLNFYPKDKNQPEKYMPEMYHHGGANWFDHDLQLLYVVIKGSEPIDIRMVPVVQVGLTFHNIKQMTQLICF